MKTSSVITVIVIIALVGGAFYLMGRGGGQPGNPPPVSDPMHSGGASSVGSLDNLVGKPAPAFSLRDGSGKEYTNESLKGKKVVLFFNEGLMCYPACWNQMVSLARDARLNASDTVTLSVVTDQPSDWQGAIRKMPGLGSVATLFDVDKAASNAFGMLTVPSSMHYGSLPGHSFVVIDKRGIVRYVFDDPNMGIDNDRIASELAQMN